VKERLKQLAMRLMRPGVEPVNTRLDEIFKRLGMIENGLAEAGIGTGDQAKYREELAYWRWLIKTEQGRASLYAPFDVAFGGWQRDRLRELGRALGITGEGRAFEQSLDEWCQGQSALEIGAGPYPALAAAPAWKRAVAADPLARGYAEEGLLPKSASHVVYVEARGEKIPLPSGFADLVIIENALDHVSDPAAVLTEIRRLLRPGGLLWLLVDLSTYSDHMHPHPFDEARVRRLLNEGGFQVVTDRVSDHKSHPKAYGEYRGLLRKPQATEPEAPVVHTRVERPAEAVH
jgi:ubiquinone/menaquinone biosynthesis C-methylase UbiE